MTHRQPCMGTARLCLVPCGFVLLIDVFCWLEFYKFGCSWFCRFSSITTEIFFPPFGGIRRYESGFPGKSICCTEIGESVAESCS